MKASHLLPFFIPVFIAGAFLVSVRDQPVQDRLYPCLANQEQCSIPMGDLESICVYLDTNTETLYEVLQTYDQQWASGADTQINPLALGYLYLLVAQEVPPAYQSYNALVAQVLDRQPDDRNLFVGFFNLTTTPNTLLSPAPFMLTQSYQSLYDGAKTRLTKAGFDSSVSSPDGKAPELPSFACGEYQERVVALGLLANQLQTDDEVVWLTLGGRAAMHCSVCEETGHDTYAPHLAYQYYAQAGLETEAEVVAAQVSELYLVASIGVAVPEQLDLSVCERSYVILLRDSFSTHELIDRGIEWLTAAHMTRDEKVKNLAASALIALLSGQVETAELITYHIEKLQLEETQADPYGFPVNDGTMY